MAAAKRSEDACFDHDLFSVFEDTTKTNAVTSQRDVRTCSLSEELASKISGGKHGLEEDDKVSKKIKVDDDGGVPNTDEISLPRLKIHTLETAEACTHEVVVPHDADYVPLKQSSSKPAKEYNFILDPFQKEALLCLECNQSVLVSAHTSAGKTVVAEYAIAMSLRDKQRVIYTTPIKALSNQKYRELFEEFKDVGLMTGDITINPTASCLIMTTEILRSMLYRGSEVMHEVAWVIFDEIHYMRDPERGVVWEETIILLPDSVHYVFLSATIPNARQFAEWICYLHKQPCHVVYTDYRPVPLQHYIFPSGGDGLHLVVDEQGNFKEDNFNVAMSVLENKPMVAKKQGKGKNLKGREIDDCFKIVKMIMERSFAPVIVFSFSKKECEGYAMHMSKLDFNTSEEKILVQEVFTNAMDVLSDEDKKLPQVEHVLPLLKRGIGIHHSGLLPILKETIEILFGEGLIKALFATETFSMGLNMPARTVMFTNIRKFDGKSHRWVTSGEYIQMSGRAGRRGLDDRGIVILMVDEMLTPAIGRNLVKGNPDPMNSAFHLTYNMVLNLLRVEEINPEYMMERSFCQFQNYAKIPELYKRVQCLQQDYDGMEIHKESDVMTYYKIRQQLHSLSVEFQQFITKPHYLQPFLQPGRMVKIKTETQDFGWGIVINFHLLSRSEKDNPKVERVPTVEVLLHLDKGTTNKLVSSIKPCPKGATGEMQVVPMAIQQISDISSIRLYFPQDLKPVENRMSVLRSIQEVHQRFPNGVPLLDPVEDMGIKEETFKKIVEKIEALEHRLYTHALHNDPQVETLCSQYQCKIDLHDKIKAAKQELKKAKSLLQMMELKCRKRVLRRFGYCTEADVIELKGRVACEINGADELVVTEMLFNNSFKELSVPEMVALLSCLVFQEKSKEVPKLTSTLAASLRQLQDVARRVARVSKEAKLEVDEDGYVESFRPQLIDVVHAWCKGSTFHDICKMTDVFEGSIIRCMRRLEELLRQMSQAAKAIGNTELETKLAEGIKCIKRDIVFAASLYL